jgi:hypothetical protein
VEKKKEEITQADIIACARGMMPEAERNRFDLVQSLLSHPGYKIVCEEAKRKLEGMGQEFADIADVANPVHLVNFKARALSYIALQTSATGLRDDMIVGYYGKAQQSLIDKAKGVDTRREEDRGRKADQKSIEESGI